MLRLQFSDYETLRAHGVETYPHECCGVLLGRAEDSVNVVRQVVAAGNTRVDSAHNRYSISPVELIRIQRQARGAGLDIVGFYHSHPDHPAHWSPTDHAEAHWLGCSYVITRVAGDGKAGVAEDSNSFLLTGTSEEDKQFLDEPIEILVAEDVTA
jgi:proteasome lid subunit RPN8/RPN11